MKIKNFSKLHFRVPSGEKGLKNTDEALNAHVRSANQFSLYGMRSSIKITKEGDEITNEGELSNSFRLDLRKNSKAKSYVICQHFASVIFLLFIFLLSREFYIISQ